MLYHITSPEAVESIQEEGLLPADNSDSLDPLRVAEETRDRLLDRRAREVFGSEYSDRRHSVFFYNDPTFAVTEADRSDSSIIVVDEDTLVAGQLFSANRNMVEDVFSTIKSGVFEGSVTSPAYDNEEVNAEICRIVDEDFRRWNGEQNASREVWGVGRVPPDKIEEVWD